MKKTAILNQETKKDFVIKFDNLRSKMENFLRRYFGIITKY